MHLFYLAHIGGIAIFLLIILLLVVYGKNKRYLNLMLATGLCGFVWYVFIFLLNATGYVRHFPFLFNKGLPLYYLIGPSLYIYFRGIIYKNLGSFRKVDLFHLLVALPAVISITPYCLLDTAEQQKVVDQVAKDPNYLFSGAKYIVGIWHWGLWPFVSMVYTVLQLSMIKKAHNTALLPKNTIRWMCGISLILLATFSLLLVTNLGMIFRSMSNEARLLSPSMVVILCGCFLLLALAFFINPSFIYGNAIVTAGSQPQTVLYLSNQKMKKEKSDTGSSPRTQPDLELVGQLEDYLAESKLYLERGLTLSKLSAAVDIPSYKLSELLNHHYQKNFNAYINAWRIKDIIQRFQAGEHRSLTLEAISNESGFASRKSFFTAFKNEMGVSPSAYIAAMR